MPPRSELARHQIVLSRQGVARFISTKMNRRYSVESILLDLIRDAAQVRDCFVQFTAVDAEITQIIVATSLSEVTARAWVQSVSLLRQ